MTPASILYALAGYPAQPGTSNAEPGTRCRVCGSDCSRAQDYDRWQGSSFTDQSKLRDWSSAHVCEACIWAHAWNVPPGFPPPAEGKKGVNLRLYSHFWCENLLAESEYHAWNKANKREIRDWLRAPKSGRWFAAIADTGQKHVLPWTPMNFRGAGDLPARGVVRFEETNIRLGSFALVDAMCSLLTAGATKEEVASGSYGVRAYQLARRDVEAFESDFGRASRDSGWFSLALWLAQRDEDAVKERMAAEKAAREEKKHADAGAKRGAARPDSGLRARGESRVPGKRSKRAEALDATRGGDRGRSHAGKSDREQVVHARSEKAEGVRYEQIDLFGD